MDVLFQLHTIWLRATDPYVRKLCAGHFSPELATSRLFPLSFPAYFDPSCRIIPDWLKACSRGHRHVTSGTQLFKDFSVMQVEVNRKGGRAAAADEEWGARASTVLRKEIKSRKVLRRKHFLFYLRGVCIYRYRYITTVQRHHFLYADSKESSPFSQWSYQ